MKRIYLLTVLMLLFIGQYASAQLASFGIRGGLNFPTMSNVVEASQDRSLPLTFGVGLVGRLRFDQTIFKVELNYERKGYKVNLNHGDGTYEFFKANYFEIPVLFEYSFYSSEAFDLYSEIGLYAAYWNSASLERCDTMGGQITTTTKDVELVRTNTNYLYSQYDAGVIVGAGGKRMLFGGSQEVYLGARASYGFMEALIYTGPGASVRADGAHHFVMSITLGYFFNNFDKTKHLRMRKGPYY